MCNKHGDYIWIKHRILYAANTLNGSLWLTLCLYNFSYESELPQHAANGLIINTVTGNIIIADNHIPNILSGWEIEILRLIRNGKMSKEIAHHLSISINTVNRHRQNILKKLKVNNSIEACRITELMRLI
ncbi:MAG TPA: LuxR C-terminal-related transcriptional regulator [Arachidicoccus sp.]